METVNGHVKVDISFELTCGALHGPSLKWDYNCILSIDPRYRKLRFTWDPAN